MPIAQRPSRTSLLATRLALPVAFLGLGLVATTIPGCGGNDGDTEGTGGSGYGVGGTGTTTGTLGTGGGTTAEGSGGSTSTPTTTLEGIDPDSVAATLLALTPSDTAGTPQTTSPGLGAASSVGAETSVTAPTQDVSEFIVVDQFGYLPASEKMAIVRDPVTEIGDVAATKDFTPGATYRLIDASDSSTALEGSAAVWNSGAEHEQSGDKAWRFDFSSVTTPGIYYVLDVENDVRSDVFRIASDAYREVMKQAVRTFYYQRAGFAKETPYAEADWADGASHMGTGQDTEATLYGGDASTARDVSGGWYDAGDYNKYTPWTSDYIVEMLRAYTERPEAFGDDYNLPDSGNGVADIIDEAIFGLEHLVRLQEDDGSVISVMGLDGASPPSAADGSTVYGPPTTNASVRASMAYAWGALTLAEMHPEFAAGLTQRAMDAYAWADANPAETFENSGKVAAGEQQSSDEDVAIYKLGAALALYRLTGDPGYLDYFETNYEAENYHAFAYSWLGAYQLAFTDIYLDYTTLSDADAAVAAAVLTPISTALNAGNLLGNLSADQDPYMAHHDDMTWGSNSIRSRTGLLSYAFITYDIDATKEADAAKNAERYVHYIHGVNPLQMVYLSAMERFGAHKSVSTFYHTWFHDGSAFDTNPAPGFLVGGPNSSYTWDSCCDAGTCGGDDHPECSERPIGADPSLDVGSDPASYSYKPAMKAYWEFNQSWPVNSWSVTENSDGYQLAYIRLLSKYVN